MVEVRVEKLEQVSRDSYILEFGRFFDFEPGQVIRLCGAGMDEPRLYSIASGSRDANVQVLFNVVDSGKLTPRLADLRRGDRVMASPAFGRFSGTEGEAWWIAQGTGLAPFLSMFRSGMGANKTLLHGGRYADSFYFAGELSSALGDRYVRCCSREEGEGLFHGRVTDYLSIVNELRPDALYYLCGSAEMVVETRDILIARGVPFRQIVSEIYF